MQFMFKERFNYIDLIWLFAVTTALAEGRLWLALWIALGGLVIAGLLAHFFLPSDKPNPRDMEWQAFANMGEKIEAVKAHRREYDSGLYDALVTVEKYMGLPPRERIS